MVAAARVHEKVDSGKELSCPTCGALLCPAHVYHDVQAALLDQLRLAEEFGTDPRRLLAMIADIDRAGAAATAGDRSAEEHHRRRALDGLNAFVTDWQQPPEEAQS